MLPETPVSDLAVYTARPTIRIDGEEQLMVNEFLLALEMTEQEGGLSALELRLSNIASDTTGDADLAFEDDTILRLGARIAVYTGDVNGPIEIFQGVITGLEGEFPESGPPELTVLAEDAFQLARMSRRTRVLEDTSIADLAEELASQLSLTPVITGLDESHSVLVQLNETDLAFLRRLLACVDGDMQVVGEELHISPRGEVQRGTPTLGLHSQLRSARVTADLAHQVNEITVAGWDALQGERISVASTGSDFGPGTGNTGDRILRDALIERSQHVGHQAVATESEAQALADAYFNQRARRFVTIDANAQGNASLRVGAHVAIEGLGPRFDNTYYITSACHRWDVNSGYETEFTGECGYWGGN